MNLDVDESDDGLVLNLATDSLDVNVYFARGEIERLRDVASADWNTRTSIAAGTAAGRTAWWSSTEREVTLLIGDDDEAWDISVSGVQIESLLAAVDQGLALEAG